MNFNVNQFRANGLPFGGARPSLFEVQFPNVNNLITAIPSTQQLGDQSLLFQCSAASIPAARIDAIPVYYFGRVIYVPGERTFDAWSVTIYNDEDYGLRNFFESWSNQINSLQGNLATSSVPAQLKVDHVSVVQWGKAGQLIRQYQFFGMMPVIVGDIQLAWNQGNQIETFDVRFVYDWWEPANASIPDQNQTSQATYDPGDQLANQTALSNKFTNNVLPAGTNLPAVQPVQ